MLVLSRQVGKDGDLKDTIFLNLHPGMVIPEGGMQIKVVLTSLHGNRAQIGIDAPKSVHIQRGDISKDGARIPPSEIAPSPE